MLIDERSSKEAARARFQSWAAQIQLFVAELPPKERGSPEIEDLLNRFRELRMKIRVWSGADSERPTVRRAWRRLKRAWDRAVVNSELTAVN